MDSAELTEMIAADSIGPPRWVRMVCTQLAVLTARVFNATKDSGSPAARMEDFLPWHEPRREQTVEELEMFCEALAMTTQNAGGE